MKIEVKHKYLIFPVNTLSSCKKMTFSCNEEADYTLDIRLDNISPNFYAYIDVSRFMDKTISIWGGTKGKLLAAFIVLAVVFGAVAGGKTAVGELGLPVKSTGLMLPCGAAGRWTP